MVAFSTDERRRRRLARELRAYARNEREQSHRASVIELSSVAQRAALLEDLIRRLEDVSRPVSRAGLERLEELLAEPLPFRDYGPRAALRNERIARILVQLESEAG
jgi:hypothetical protein